MSIELPKDAEGREIPLDTALLYGKVSGEEYEVVCFNFSPSMRRWRVKLKRRDDVGIYATDSFTLSKSDNWEKLEEDLGMILNHPEKIVCAYFNRERKDCDGCKLKDSSDICFVAVIKDIAASMNRLCGDSECGALIKAVDE